MPSTRRRRRRYVPIRSRKLQVAKVAIPSEIPGSAAIFLALRRMRQPLLILILVMAVAVGGLTMMPGLPQPDGSSGQLSIFEAFYVFSFTATT
ncbi:MAG: hypothetical protein FWD55_07685, partial [Propionibacteriaceae bacterium]|nr:hypothetical protein [Propionibacteriaceae bacterium]